MPNRLVEYTEAGPLDSSALDYYWYDARNRELYVRFAGSNRIAGYKEVSEQIVQNLLNAYSIGSYYSNSIKGRFVGLNTDVVFQKAQPVLSAGNMSITNSGDVVVNGTLTVKGTTEKRKYKVFAVCEIVEELQAVSVDDAVAAFLDSYDDSVKVTKVEVLFD